MFTWKQFTVSTQTCIESFCEPGNKLAWRVDGKKRPRPSPGAHLGEERVTRQTKFSVTTNARQKVRGQVLLVFSYLFCLLPSSPLPLCTLPLPIPKVDLRVYPHKLIHAKEASRTLRCI